MDQCIPLYALANSLDPSITHLLHQQERLEKDLSTSEIGIVEGRKICDDLRQKFEQAKQTLFVLPSVPSTLVAPSIPIPLVGIMDRIAELVVKVFSAPVIVVAKNASIATPTTNVGPLDQAKGDGGNVDTSLIEPTDMVTDSVANP